MKYNTISSSSTSSVSGEGKKSTFTCYTDEEDATSKVYKCEYFIGGVVRS